MARRRPRTFRAWVLDLAGAIISALIIYQARIAIIENMGRRQIEHTQTALQKIQE